MLYSKYKIKTNKMANIKVYSAPWCVYCKMVKAFLEENKIQYKEVDIEKDDKAREEMVAKTGSLSIPVTDIDGEIIIGFDKPAIKKALNLK